MPRDSAVLAEVAGAILDGTSIDWASAESSADAVERSLLDPLRVVAARCRRASSSSGPNGRRAAGGQPEAADNSFNRSTGGISACWNGSAAAPSADVYRAWDTPTRSRGCAQAPASRSSMERRPCQLDHRRGQFAGSGSPSQRGQHLRRRAHRRAVGLWMEFVDGRTLEQMLQQGHVFAQKEAVRHRHSALPCRCRRTCVGPPSSRHQSAQRDVDERQPRCADGLRHGARVR